MSESLGSSGLKSSSFKKTLPSLHTDSSFQKDSKKFFSHKSIRQFDTVVSEKSKRRLEFSQTKTSFYHTDGIVTPKPKKTNHNPQKRQVGVQHCEKQTTVEEVLNKTIKLINEQYKKEIDWSDYNIKQESRKKVAEFNQKLRQSLLQVVKNIKKKSKQLASHLNAIFYSSCSVKILQFSQIEKQLMRDWKQNPLLGSFKSQWFLLVQKYLQELGKQAQIIFSQIMLQQFCSFLAYITYVIYKNYFTYEISKNHKKKEQIINKLSNQTMRYLISQGQKWQNVVILSIQGMLARKINKIVIDQQTKNYLIQTVINEMKLQPFKQYLIQAHLNKKQLFIETQRAIACFTKQHYLKSKIKSIIDIRVCLQQDILTYQKILIEQDKIKEFKMFEKDGMLTCLILAILCLSNKKAISVIELSLKEIRLMLGTNFQQILGINKCPSYFADLESAIDFIDLEIASRKKNEK